MSDDAPFYWQHAQTALNAARQTLAIDPSTVANRAYYAAFYAVSALFAADGKTYKTHAGVEAAVTRDLVNTGRWSKDLGSAFRALHKLRGTADYDMSKFVSDQESQEAVKQAETILEAVRAACPEFD